MRAIEIFRKNGYRQIYNSNNVMIYELRKKRKYSKLPDTILFSKGIDSVERIEFSTDNPEEYISTGTFCFNLTNEMLQAINKQIEEVEENLSKKPYNRKK